MPLRWSEIDAWARLYDYRIAPWELDVLAMLDDTWLQIVSKRGISPAELLAEEEGDPA